MSENRNRTHEKNLPTAEDLIRELHKRNHQDMAEKVKTAVEDFHNRNKDKFCCFCNKKLTDIGNSPYPF